MLHAPGKPELVTTSAPWAPRVWIPPGRFHDREQFWAIVVPNCSRSWFPPGMFPFGVGVAGGVSSRAGGRSRLFSSPALSCRGRSPAGFAFARPEAGCSPHVEGVYLV